MKRIDMGRSCEQLGVSTKSAVGTCWLAACPASVVRADDDQVSFLEFAQRVELSVRLLFGRR